nr:hypothetical protein [Azospirillum oleiclasticum]
MALCSDADLDPLVACIAEALPDAFEAEDTYRRHRPRHSLYHRLIGDALRRCGDSPDVGAVRGEGPTYDALVIDVCRKLDVPHVPGNTAENELNLLTLYLGQPMAALEPGDEAAALARARNEASSNAATVGSAAREGASALLSHARHLRGRLAALNPDEVAPALTKAREVTDKVSAAATTATGAANALLSRLGGRMTTLAPGGEPAIVAKAAAGAAAGAASFLSRAVSGQLEQAVSGFRLTEPLFKATVPCVLHIAFLRKKHLDRLAAAADTTPATPTRPVRADGTATAVAAASDQSPGTALIIGASAGKPVLSLTRVSEPSPRTWHPIGESDDSIARLNPLLPAVPSLATALEMARTHYMEVMVDGSLVQANGGGFRGWVQGADGKIVEQARLFDASTLSNLVNATALFQIASVAVAQKHLADISRKLSAIKAAVDRIQRFQNNERRSVLTGAIRYFEQIAPSVLAGELSDGIRHQIERHEAQLLQVQEHLLEDIRHESHAIRMVKDSGLGSKGMQDAIRAHQDLLADLYGQLFLCIRARACGWQLLQVFPGEAGLKDSRRRSILEALGTLDRNGDLLRDTDRSMRDKVKTLSSFWNSAATLNQRKLDLLAWNGRLMAEVVACKEQIGEDIRAAEAMSAERLQPVRLMLKLDGDRIAATCPA